MRESIVWLDKAAMMRDASPFRDNSNGPRFEWTESGFTAFADYRRDGDRITIPHVEAPPALRGKGTAGRLMQAIAAHARLSGLRVVPTCGYAKAWFRRHQEYADILV